MRHLNSRCHYWINEDESETWVIDGQSYELIEECETFDKLAEFENIADSDCDFRVFHIDDDNNFVDTDDEYYFRSFLLKSI